MKNHQVHVILLTLAWIQASDLKYAGSEGGNAQLQSNSFAKKHTRFTHILRKPQNMESSRPPARRGQRPEAIFQSSPTGTTSSINILAGFAGKKRVLVISAPSDSDVYYRLMMSLLKPDVYCEMADRHMQQIIMFHEKGKMGGKVRRVGNQGSLAEEPLDPALVPRLMGFLKLEDGKFGMVLLRKTLQVEERYPYPVQLEAIYEAIDQTPMRRLEKARQKGFVQKCKSAGVEGRVVQPDGSNATHRVPQPTPITQAQISTTTLRTTTTTPPTTILPTTTSTITTDVPSTVAQTHPHTTPRLSVTSNFYRKHLKISTAASPTQASTPKGKPPRERDTHRPNKPETELFSTQKGKIKADGGGRKKTDGPGKALKKIPAGKTNASVQIKNAFEERAAVEPNPKKALEAFLSYFQRRRRLIVGIVAVRYLGFNHKSFRLVVENVTCAISIHICIYIYFFYHYISPNFFRHTWNSAYQLFKLGR